MSELERYLESYENVDGLLPPSAEGLRRLQEHFDAIRPRVRVILEGGEYVAEYDGKREILSIGPDSY